MKLIAAVVLASTATFAVATSSTASAQKEDPRDLAAQDCSRAKQAGKPCVLTFGEGDEIEGGVAGGTGFDISTREGFGFASLIRIRTDFIAEIIRAAEEL